MEGRNEAWTARGNMGGKKRAEEGLTEEGMKQGEGEQGREENFKGGIPRREQASVQCIHEPFHNAAFGLETLVLQMKNSDQAYIINSVL